MVASLYPLPSRIESLPRLSDVLYSADQLRHICVLLCFFSALSFSLNFILFYVRLSHLINKNEGADNKLNSMDLDSVPVLVDIENVLIM